MWDRMSSQKGYKGPSHLAGGENCPYSFYSEKNKYVFNENTNFFLENFFDLYLMKIQIYFYSKKISDQYLMKIQICFF